MTQDADSAKLPGNQRALAVINALLDKHGVQDRQRNASLIEATGLSYAAVRRRMMGEVPWGVDEIIAIGRRFGEAPFSLLGGLIDEPGQPGVLMLGGQALACTFWKGDRSPAVPAGSLVAVHEQPQDRWAVLPVQEAARREFYEVRRLLVETDRRRRVAVLDDDIDLATSIAEFLRLKGHDALPFRSAQDLQKALDRQFIDGFIIDWLLGQKNVRNLLPTIREHNPAGPVILLTGQIESGRAREDELAPLMATFALQLYEKPTRPLMLSNALELGFAQMGQVPDKASTAPPG